MAGSFARYLVRRASAREHDVQSATRRIKRGRVTAIRSTGHVLELREVERLRPCKPALGEHLKHRFNALRVVQAADGDEDQPRKALQVAAEHPGAASGAEVSI